MAAQTIPVTPGIGQSVPPPGASRQEQLQIYASDFDMQFGAGTGQGYLAIAQTHPHLTPKQDAELFTIQIMTGGLAKALSDATQGVAKLTGIAGSGTVNAANQLEKDTIGKFSLSGWFLRVGEILAGLVLIGIGLNSMLKGRPLNIVTSAAGLAAKAVPK